MVSLTVCSVQSLIIKQEQYTWKEERWTKRESFILFLLPLTNFLSKYSQIRVESSLIIFYLKLH